MREEKKYEILPGVEIPDIKKIQEAASDFSISEVGDVDIKSVNFEPVFEVKASSVDVTRSVSPARKCSVLQECSMITATLKALILTATEYLMFIDRG